ncbi:zinc-dependent dehydrogenase [uncultured Metabacillus sp.]|uniref:zinc-dependent dehydrogenase n=1 Tax=uncultured Metabacillus sp. TaxID=2860135 RepID=UPI00260BB286|nr:zinc-dependent dehydrogenase [uncultured Metabacillus sp.]
MKAAVYYDKGDFRFQEMPLPLIKEDEVLLKMHACGLCGTDIHKALEKTVPPKTVLGHEVSGEIVKIGSEVDGYQVGDRVFVAHHVPCFTCHYCRKGSYSLCPQFKQTNLDPGGFSEYIRVPSLHVKHTMGKIPEDLSYEEGALVEPIACCLHGFESILFQPGDSVLIMGAGQIGCMQVQIAKYLMAGKIMVSDINPYRLNKSLEFGADYAIDSKNEDVVQQIMDITDGLGVNIAIISAGIQSLLPQAMECVARGGTILVFAPFKNELVPVQAARFFNDEVKIIGSYSSNPYNYQVALEMLRNRVFDVEKMVTHRFSLAQLNEAIECAHDPSEQVLKVLIKP